MHTRTQMPRNRHTMPQHHAIYYNTLSVYYNKIFYIMLQNFCIPRSISMFGGAENYDLPVGRTQIFFPLLYCFISLGLGSPEMVHFLFFGVFCCCRSCTSFPFVYCPCIPECEIAHILYK